MSRLLKQLQMDGSDADSPGHPAQRTGYQTVACRILAQVAKAAWRRARVLRFRGRIGVLPLLPGLVRTYAPKGQTPVIHEKQTRDHLSVMGGMTPEGKVL